MISFRRLAEWIDPLRPPRGLSGAAREAVSPGLAELHRWPGERPPGSLSLREIGRRHTDIGSSRLRLLWFNTELLAASSARHARAREIAAAIAAPGDSYDVAALCEVLRGVPEVEAGVDRGSPQVEVGTVPATLEKAIRTRAPDVERASGPGPGSRSFSSGLETFVLGHGIIGSAGRAFERTGTSPVDNLARKGVLRTSLAAGPGVLDVYSTHMASGLLRIPAEDLDDVQLAQVDEVLQFVTDHRARHPDRMAVVCGDFNIAALDSPRSRAGLDPARLEDRAYVKLVQKMDAHGFADCWPDRGGPLGYTYYDRHGGRSVEPICSPAPDDERYCDDRPPDVTDADPPSGPGFTDAFRRIDYVFVERPAARHRYRLDYARPRRVPFRRPSSAPEHERHPTISDHLGLELRILLSPR